MRRNWQVPVMATFTALVGLPQHEAEAYCVSDKPLIAFWSAEFSDLRIPVWVNISADYSVESTGQTPQDIARLVIEVIARHNESVRAPKLYFAGFATQGFDYMLTDQNGDVVPWGALPAGINVMSLECAEKLTVCGEDALACASLGIRGSVGMDQSTHDDPIGWVFLSPADCGVNYSLSAYADLGQIMLHEIGHTLGLQHSNREKSVCETGNNIYGGPTMGTVGVMHGAAPASFAVYQRSDLDTPCGGRERGSARGADFRRVDGR
jgi:hypothetical protein